MKGVNRHKMTHLHAILRYIRVIPRFFDQVGHETMYAYIENKHFFTKLYHHQIYQNNEQSSQKLQNSHFQSHFLASKTESF